MERLTILFQDPRSAPPRVCSDLPPQEEREPCLRWLALRRLRQGPHCPCLPDRGAEDRQEGPEGVAAEGWQALSRSISSVLVVLGSERYGKRMGTVLLESKKGCTGTASPRAHDLGRGYANETQIYYFMRFPRMSFYLDAILIACTGQAGMCFWSIPVPVISTITTRRNVVEYYSVQYMTTVEHCNIAQAYQVLVSILHTSNQCRPSANSGISPTTHNHPAPNKSTSSPLLPNPQV